MNEQNKVEVNSSRLNREPLSQPPKRRGPGRGIGEKRITQERLDELNTIFDNLHQIHRFLTTQGHIIINESGSLLASQSHQNLEQLLRLLEDFLWVLNCAIAKNGGQPILF